jgi:Secretion system C-terminal sorting domain
MMMKKLFFIVLFLKLSWLFSQATTAIPDSNFEEKLIVLGIDSGVPDGTVATSNINGVTDLDVSNTFDAADAVKITDLTGIEGFVALTTLKCNYNLLNTINVAQNTQLLELRCDNNRLSSLDISKNLALNTFYCHDNQLTNIDVSQNVELTILECQNNQLVNLDVTKNTKLTGLWCFSNRLTAIDVSKNSELNGLSCFSNRLTNLDVSQNTKLYQLYCNNNQLTNLDVSKNSQLTRFSFSNNQLITVNIKNGNNANIIDNIDFRNNPNLICIEVDNVNFSNTNWTNFKDASSSFNENCGELLAPKGLKIVALDYNQVTFTWNAPSSTSTLLQYRPATRLSATQDYFGAYENVITTTYTINFNDEFRANNGRTFLMSVASVYPNNVLFYSNEEIRIDIPQPIIDLKFNEDCGFQDLYYNITNGTPPYTANLSDLSSGTILSLGPVADVAPEYNKYTSILANGLYKLTVVGANNINAFKEFEIKAINSPIDVTYKNLSNNSIEISATGGIPPYRFSRDNRQTFQTDAVISNLNEYTEIEILDAGTCYGNYIYFTPSPSNSVNSNLIFSFPLGATLADIKLSGVNIKWYSAKKGKSNIKIRRVLQSRRESDLESLPLSTVLENGTTYYATQTINGIESESFAVTVRLVNDLNVYPNPVNDFFTIENNIVINSVQLYSSTGQEIKNIKPNSAILKIDASEIKSGVYFMKVQTNNQTKMLKIVKQ